MGGEAQLAVIVLIVLIVGTWIFLTYHSSPQVNQNNPDKERISNALSKMQRLWTENSYLTRMSNIEDLTGYTGSSVTNEKFLNNARQLGRNFGNIYGDDKGVILSDLLIDYHKAMMDVVKKIRQHRFAEEDILELKEKNKKIIDFLVDTNSCFDRNTLQRLFDSHVDNYLRSVIHTIKGETVASMAAFDTYNKATQELIDYIDECSWRKLVGEPRYI